MSSFMPLRDAVLDSLIAGFETSAVWRPLSDGSETFWYPRSAVAAVFELTPAEIDAAVREAVEAGELTADDAIISAERLMQENVLTFSNDTTYVSLDAVLAIGYRLKSDRAADFRRHAGRVLGSFAVKGFALDDERLKNGSLLTSETVDDLREELDEIRRSSRTVIQRASDLYMTAWDYDRESPTTRRVFHGLAIQSADEPTYTHDERQAAEAELESLIRFAEARARRGQVVTMSEWAEKLVGFPHVISDAAQSK